MCYENFTIKPLQQQVIKDGKRVMETESLDTLRDYVKQQLEQEIWESELRFDNPHVHYLDMSPEYYEMKMDLLYKSQKND